MSPQFRDQWIYLSYIYLISLNVRCLCTRALFTHRFWRPPCRKMHEHVLMHQASPPWCGEHTHHAPGTTQQAGLCSCVNLCPDPLPQEFIPVACHCFYNIICLNRPAPFLVLFIQGRGRGNVNTIMIIKTVASDCGSNPLPRPFF